MILANLWKTERTSQDDKTHDYVICGTYIDIKSSLLPFVFLSDVILLREVHQINHGLGCQKQVFVQNLDLWRKQTVVVERGHKQDSGNTVTQIPKHL